MASSAAASYASDSLRSLTIRRAISFRGRPRLSRDELQSLYGAAFVVGVAAWNAYVIRLVREFYAEASDPLVRRFHAMHTVAKGAADGLLARFNTPNSDNTRNILVQCTSYDPLNDWHWPAGGLDGLAVRTRLDEIVKVRHSFAHGASMPAYSWNRSPQGEVRLTAQIVRWNHAFFGNLVQRTDRGMREHLRLYYGAAASW